MKTLTTSLSIAASLCFTLLTPSEAALIAFDQFSGYTTGSIYNKTPSSGSAGFTAAWIHNTSHVSVESAGLTHSLAVNQNADGNIFIRDQATPRTNLRAFDSASLTAIDAASTVYFSGLFRTSELAASNNGPVWFGIGANAASGSMPSNGVYFIQGGASNQFAIWNNGSSQSLSLVPAVNTTYLFTVGINFNTNEISYQVFADGASISTPTTSGSFTGSITQSAITHLLAGHTANNSGFTSDSTTPRFDEFRLGTTMDAVVIPEPSTYAALLGLLTLGLVIARRRRC